MAGLYPESPGAPSYAAPLMDFSPIGNLANDYYKGAQNKLDYGKARAFQEGLPRDATGNIDFSAVADRLARFGDIEKVVPLANTELDRRLIDAAMREGGLNPIGGAGGGGAPAPGGGASGPQGQPQPAPARVMTPVASVQPQQRPEISPAGIPRVENPNTRRVPGGDDGQTSLMSIVAGKLGDEAAGPVALKIGEALKLDPNASNDPTKAANLGKYVDTYLKRNNIAAGGAQAPAAAAAPPAPAAAPPASVGGGARDPLADLLPPGVTRENAGAYLEQLRRRAAAFALSPRTAAMAKQYEDKAKVLETALQPTGGQKEAFASGGLSPLQFENAKIIAKVEAENGAKVPEQKLYAQALQQGFKGTEMEFAAAREAIKGSNFKVIGKDKATGNDVHGFVDAQGRKVYDINGKPIDTSNIIGFGGDAETSKLTGKPFLETLDPGRANQVQAIADGRMAPPGGMALKSPQIQALMRDVAQYEPGFDFTAWKSRNETRTEFTKGKSAANISSFNTAIGHLDALEKAAQKLDNSWFTPYNSVANMIKAKTGDDTIKKFEVARTAVADELTRAFRGTGGNVHDLVQWESAINAANSPKQLKGAVTMAVELLRSRIESLGKQYDRGMGKTTDPFELLDPKPKAIFKRLLGEEHADAGGAAGPPPKVATVEEAKKLPKGTRFIDPTGVERIVP